MGKFVMTVHSLSGFERVLLYIARRCDSEGKIKASVIWLLGNSLDIDSKFGRTSEHRGTPFSNIEVSSRVIQTYDSPCN